eukprot:3045501-Alexandrium_andersonii.AAC.1
MGTPRSRARWRSTAHNVVGNRPAARVFGAGRSTSARAESHRAAECRAGPRPESRASLRFIGSRAWRM